MTHVLRVASAALAMLGMAFCLNAPAAAQTSVPIEFTLIKGSFVIGVEGGSGAVYYRGTPHPISVAGLSFGLSIGLSKADLHGQVFNLHRLEDIEGIYNALQIGAAMVYGGKVVHVKNAKGVIIAVSGDSVGAEFAVDLNGMSVSLR